TRSMRRWLEEKPASSESTFQVLVSREYSASRHNFYDFEPISWLHDFFREFRRRNRLAVVFHHHASRQKLLPNQKLLDRARQGTLDSSAISRDETRFHAVSAASQSFQAGS